MAIRQLNHAVLYVRDVARSRTFYVDVLGFRDVTPPGIPMRAAFLVAADSTNDHDLGLFEVGAAAAPSAAGRGAVGLYHLAWEVDRLGDLEAIARRLQDARALVGATDHGTTKSLYGVDPDGLEFEIQWIVPADLLDEDALAARSRIAPLDLARELARFGPDARSGLGISRPA